MEHENAIRKGLLTDRGRACTSGAGVRLVAGWVALVASSVLWMQCDTVEPVEAPRLVVQAFLDAGEPLPPVRLWRTQPIGAPYMFDPSTAVADAEVEVMLDGQRFRYQPVDGEPGFYRPSTADKRVTPQASFSFKAQWRGQQATAEGTIPPPITLDSIHLDVPDRPVRAVIFDSLFIDPAVVDSLQIDSLRTGAEQGYAYPVEVTLWWTADVDEEADSLFWVRAQLRPDVPASGTLKSFFLRPEQIFREQTAARKSRRLHAWTGVYGVPVHASDPLPPHRLKVAVVRGDSTYAQFAASRDDPGRREPLSNVRGALGIVAGIAVDSMSVSVPR